MDAQNVIYVGSKKNIVDLASLQAFLEDEIQSIKSLHPEATPSIALTVDQRVDYGTFLQLFSIAQECCGRVRLVYKPLDESQDKLY